MRARRSLKIKWRVCGQARLKRVYGIREIDVTSPWFLIFVSLFRFYLKAVDADEGVNAAVSYSITGGNTNGSFTIDTNRYHTMQER